MSISDVLTMQAEIFIQIQKWIADAKHSDNHLPRARACLLQAEPIYVSPECGGLIADAAASVPAWPLRPLDLPCPHGFVLFAKPIPLPVIRRLGQPPTDISMSLSAVGFSQVIVKNKVEQEGFDLVHGAPNAISIHYFFDGFETDPLGNSNGQWYFGDESPVGEDWSDHSELPDKYPDLTLFSKTLRNILRSFFAFTQQSVFVKTRERADRGARRRAESAGIRESLGHVLLLRRAAARGDDEVSVGDGVNWSCRWWVGAHWRKQRVGPKKAEIRPTFVGPYMKGPENKPVRLRRRIIAVVR
jgi:hypothetical protein